MVKKAKKSNEVKIDILKDVKNYTSFPWKFKDDSIDEITCVNVLEFVQGKLRGKFMDEIYRILKVGGKVAISVPYWNSAMGVHDFRYEWPSLTEQSFLIFNKEWRENNKKGLELKSDFDFTYGYSAEPEITTKADDARAFSLKYYCNSVQALHLMLTKRAIK